MIGGATELRNYDTITILTIDNWLVSVYDWLNATIKREGFPYEETIP